MPARTSLIKIASARILICLLALSLNILGQTGSRPQDQSEVVRVFTDLVQTDVMVFDKQGRFADGLRREDFELRIDGKVKPIEFFERISVGSVNEETQLSAARGTLSANKTSPLGAVPLDRGRTVFFYLDDLHLGLGSLAATRKVMTDFIEKEMNQNDEAAITSASGQIGFLQQLSGQKAVLRAALQRVKYRPYSVRDFDRPAMTEYQALLIDSNDRDVFEYFLEQTMRSNPGITRDIAENMVRVRVTTILQQASNITRQTLSGLEELVKTSSKLPGRKLVFFLSDGFLLDHRNSDSLANIRKITSDAARNGVVIYSLDARGLVASVSDVSVESAFDLTGRLDRATHGELKATQDAMHALARDTGGRPVFNTNALGVGLSRALQETSVYYLLAWRPNREAQEGKFRRIEVKLLERPELTVRVRRGFYDREPAPVESKAKNSKPSVKTPEVQLREALGTAYPDRGIPIALSLNYIHAPDKRMLLSTSLKIAAESLSFSPEDGKQKAAVQILGLFFNDRGQSGARFAERLTMTALSESSVKGSDASVAYAFPVFLGPGLYQVRVAARDEKSGRTGSAHGWIEIPDLSGGKLTLSSVIIGRHAPTPTTTSSGNGQPTSEPVDLSIDRQYQRNSVLRFLFFVYNATRAPADSHPDVAAQVQILRDNQPVITTALKKIATAGVDLDRLPYAADLSLADLPAGQYVLQVTAVDRVSKTSASQQNRFSIQ
ncbi:MAG TPA: VWA domain-containing protein [Pyrinomonadaceae bacterium]|nr:VWA domain-containing protein [Pyrinomonadaceae bacterium]